MADYAILNEKVCDNYRNCSAMLSCANSGGAIYYTSNGHSQNGKILIDKSKCVACRQCLDHCGLFLIARNRVNEMMLRQEIFDQDSRTNEDFQSTERFGCEVFDKEKYSLSTTDDIDAFILASPSDQYDILEFVDDNNVLCPFQGVSVFELKAAFPEHLREYRKFVVEPDRADAIYARYHMKDLPVILLLRKGRVDNVILGRFRVNSVNNRAEEQATVDKIKKAFANAIKHGGMTIDGTHCPDEGI